MNRMKKRYSRILLVLSLLLTFLLAVPVSADMTEEEESQLAESVESFLDSIFGLEDEVYDSAREQGGFYEVMVDAIRDNQETLGDLEELETTTVETSDSAVTCKTQAKFKNYDAEIVVTFDATGATPQNFVINVEYPLSVKMAQAGKNTLIGLLVVFVVLIFLSGVIYLMRYVNPDARRSAGQGGPGSKAARTTGQTAQVSGQAAQKSAAGGSVGSVQAAGSAAAGSVPTLSGSPAAALVGTGGKGTADEGEILAVIAAAIAAAEADSLSEGGYVVRSIKKVNTSRRWKRA